MIRRVGIGRLVLAALVVGASCVLAGEGASGDRVAEEGAIGIHAGGDVRATAESGGTAVIQTGAGTVNVNTFPSSTIDEIKKLGVTEAALSSFFKILERRQVPPEDLDSTLREIAKRYRDLEQRLASFTSDDPEVVALKQAAREALGAGEFDRTETLLLTAKQKDIAAAKTMQESTRKRLLSAAESAGELGDLKGTEFAYAQATAYYAEAAELVPEGEELVRAGYLNGAGLGWLNGGRYPEAEAPLTQALAIWEEALGTGHPYFATGLNNLAALYRAQGRYGEAEPLLKRALAIREEALGPAHPDVATSLNNLAALYRAQGRYAEAEPLYERALAISEEILGPEHPDVARSLNNLAKLYYSAGRYAEAGPLYLRAIGIYEAQIGVEDPTLALFLNNRGLLCEAQGRFEEARGLYERALEIYERLPGPDVPQAVTARENYEALLAAMREQGEAAASASSE